MGARSTYYIPEAEKWATEIALRTNKSFSQIVSEIILQHKSNDARQSLLKAQADYKEAALRLKNIGYEKSGADSLLAEVWGVVK